MDQNVNFKGLAKIWYWLPWKRLYHSDVPRIEPFQLLIQNPQGVLYHP